MHAVEIISKGRAVKVSEQELEELRAKAVSWHLYCQKRLTLQHLEALAVLMGLRGKVAK